MTATAVVAAAFALVAVALLPNALAGPRASGSSVVVTITDSKLTLRPATVAHGIVTFKVEHAGLVAHSFEVGGKTTSRIAHGKTAVLKVALPKAGSYQAVAQGGAGTACAQPASTTVTVTIVPPTFTFSQTTIPCGTVTFVVTNTGQLTHSLEISAPIGAATIPTNPPMQPGQTQRFTISMTEKGIYPWQCGEREDAQDDAEFENLLVQ